MMVCFARKGNDIVGLTPEGVVEKEGDNVRARAQICAMSTAVWEGNNG